MAKKSSRRGESFSRPDLRGAWTSCAIASAGRTSRASPRSWRSWSSSSPGCGPATTSHRCPRPCPDRSSPPRRPGPPRRPRLDGARNHLPRPTARRPPRRGVGSGRVRRAPARPPPRGSPATGAGRGVRPPGGGTGPPDRHRPRRPGRRCRRRPPPPASPLHPRSRSTSIRSRCPVLRRPPFRVRPGSSSREGPAIRRRAGRRPARPTPCAGCRPAGRRSSRPDRAG